MAFFTDLDRHLAVLRDVVGAEVEAGMLPATVVGACDADVLRIVAETTAVIEAAGALRIAAAGVLAARSRREQGHGGVAAGGGHRDAVSLVQEMTGTTRTEASKQVRLGQSLLDGANLLGNEPPGDGHGDGDGRADGEGDGEGGGGDSGAGATGVGTVDEEVVASREPWHACLGRAQLAGKLTAAGFHAILRGLGEPPRGGDVAIDAEFCAAWSLAAEQLLGEAGHRTVEELAAAARTIRDRLDPAGAEARFLARFEGRSFRMWKDEHGVTHARVVFDDDSAAFLRTVIDSAMRPRRNGPRFVDETEKHTADTLRNDSRSNEQLEFDLLVDLLRAGSLADAKTVFGTRQAGVRIVATVAALHAVQDGEPASAHTEDGIHPLPAWLLAQHACDTGTRTVWTDGGGQPLRLGRAERLFTAGQRLAMAVRDGGCVIENCDRPASMCEAHHIDPYADGGTTDVDRGVLLCRFHHMWLHHSGARITRDRLGPFVLHLPPGHGEPVELKRRLALTYAWAGIDPPPPRFRTAA